MIIVVAHDKGGVGKSLTAFNLINTLNPDVAVDLDAKNCLMMLNNIRKKNTEPHNIIVCKTHNELISCLRTTEQGKTILVDCGGFDSDLTRTAIAVADLVITPCNGDITEKIGLRTFSQVLEQISEKTNKKVVGHVLFNRISPVKKNFGELDEFISHAPNLARFNSTVPQRKAIPNSAGKGLGVHDIKKPNDQEQKAITDFDNLTNEIKDIINI